MRRKRQRYGLHGTATEHRERFAEERLRALNHLRWAEWSETCVGRVSHGVHALEHLWRMSGEQDWADDRRGSTDLPDLRERAWRAIRPCIKEG